MEYKIIKNSTEEAQKILNQWRHIYNISILSMSAISTSTGVMCVILLTRESK